MNGNNKWKVEFFGEGTSWRDENLTYEQASSRVDNCPTEYMALWNLWRKIYD